MNNLHNILKEELSLIINGIKTTNNCPEMIEYAVPVILNKWFNTKDYPIMTILDCHEKYGTDMQVDTIIALEEIADKSYHKVAEHLVLEDVLDGDVEDVITDLGCVLFTEICL